MNLRWKYSLEIFSRMGQVQMGLMKVDNAKIIIDDNFGDFDYSPIVILSETSTEIML